MNDLHDDHVAEPNARFGCGDRRCANMVVIGHTCDTLYSPCIFRARTADEAVGSFAISVGSVIVLGRHPSFLEELVSLDRDRLLALTLGRQLDSGLERDTNQVDNEIFGWRR